jgi:hypothetical protein
MTREKYFEIAVHLDTIHDLFIQPTGDPFSTKAYFTPGIEFIKGELPTTRWRRGMSIRTTIVLPRASMEPDLAEKTVAALQRYCHFKLQQNKRAMIASRRQALIALLLGTLFLISGLFLSQFLGQLTFVPQFLSALFSDGFVIAFWVILWRPIDFFLFELEPYWREDRIYKRLMTMQINITEELT